MNEEYDVVIAGSGPAGSSTAKECARRGLNVLVLDRNNEIGTPKRCGEGLSDNSVRQLKLDIPSNCIAQKVDGAVIYAPNGKRVEIKFEGSQGYILERKMFDKWLAKEAARAGAKIIAKSEVTDVLKSGNFVSGVKANVLGEKKNIKSKIVVAADGVESLVMRKAGIKTHKNPMFVDSGFQYEMVGLNLQYPNMISLYFGNKIAPRGYVWIFPKGNDVANVGIGIGGAYGGVKTAKHYLDKWIQQHPEINKGSIIEVNGGCIPVGGLMKNMVGDGILGIGDAVNQVNPIHGGGIAESIKASKIAADAVKDALESGDVSSQKLSVYNERWWKERGEMLEKVEKVREFFEKLNDDEMNDLADVLSGEDLAGLAHGQGLGNIIKIYMKFKAKGLKRKFWSSEY